MDTGRPAWEGPASRMTTRTERVFQVQAHYRSPGVYCWGRCIGNSFALMEARIILAAMVQRLRLKAIPGPAPRPKPVVTMGIANGLPMWVIAIRGEPSVA